MKSTVTSLILSLLLTVTLGLLSGAAQAQGKPGGCLGPPDPDDPLKWPTLQRPAKAGEGLSITKPCRVIAGSYRFGNVNILGDGTLTFADAAIDFWASGILIENGGTLIAGSAEEPIGSKGGLITFHLWGKDANAAGTKPDVQGVGITCLSPGSSPCGIPDALWKSNEHAHADPKTAIRIKNVKDFSAASYPPGRTDDYFYAYEPLFYDGGADPLTKRIGYFGYKVIGVSYGGSLHLFGKKGVATGAIDDSSSGLSWVRLNKSVGGFNAGESCEKGACQLALDRIVDWKEKDIIVVTTTDYLPGHSEELQITGIAKYTDPKDKLEKTLLTVDKKIEHLHNGELYDLSTIPSRLDLKDASGKASKATAETRAAVGLLSRSIRIVSAGDTVNDDFPAEPAWTDTSPPGYFFGGQLIARQGFKTFQVSGVEFYQLGQGGKIGHYPIHFHHARQTSPDTFVRDSSIHDSMTRWIVLHGTHDVTLQRNVGYKSIGHGFFLEDGTEINNRLVGNLGVFARAAINNQHNPRKVPGIFAAKTAFDWTPNPPPSGAPRAWVDEAVPFYSDFDHPAVFWIMNGYNDFLYNMAAGAGACGACYWLLPGANSGMSRHMKWDDYASLQASPMNIPTDRAGLTPLKAFFGNQCSTAQMSFNVTGNTSACIGIVGEGRAVGDGDKPVVAAIANPLAPDACAQSNILLPGGTKLAPWTCAAPTLGSPSPPHARALEYYPQVGGGGRFPTKCDKTNWTVDKVDPKSPGDCSDVKQCSADQLGNCIVTVIDNYTSSFHWPQTNFAAIWLRKDWYLVQNSVLSDVINAGLTFVTGGGYTDSDVIPGHWALAYKNVFIGETQANNPLASIGSPVNDQTNALRCEAGGGGGNHCLISKEGVSFPKDSFGVNTRMFNIYDGPAYQESNAYLNIKTTTLDCTPGVLSTCGSSAFLQGPLTGVPRDGTKCYLPHAAIGWKQPNGFYYPPAFHSDNLFFDAVDIRHYVTQPLFENGSYKTNFKDASEQYCNFNDRMFDGWTDIDRQTELNDDDGSLTGYQETISVNEDAFFAAPREAIECASDETAKTSPYDYVTTVVFPRCLAVPGLTCGTVAPDWDPNGRIPAWNTDCGSAFCYGVPLYRQLMTGSENKAFPSYAPQARMAGQGTGQRSTLSANNGVYYIDTTVGAASQTKDTPGAIRITSTNVFREKETYYVALLFAKETTTQKYQFYVGPDFKKEKDVWAVRAHLAQNPPSYDKVATLPEGWLVEYDGSIATVTMSMKDVGLKFKEQYLEARHNGCQPASFCAPVPAVYVKGKESVCGCAKAEGTNTNLDPRCSDAVCSWAGNDPECPVGGCWGFGFTLPEGFKTDQPVDLASLRACFDKTKGWDTQWANAGSKDGKDDNKAGTDIAGKSPVCYKAPVRPDNFCVK